MPTIVSAKQRPFEIPSSIACLSANQKTDFYAKSKIVANETGDVMAAMIGVRTLMYLRMEEMIFESRKRVEACETKGSQKGNVAYCTSEAANIVRYESELEKFPDTSADDPKIKKLVDDVSEKLKKLRSEYSSCEM
jgi:hypothetical protein